MTVYVWNTESQVSVVLKISYFQQLINLVYRLERGRVFIVAGSTV